MAAKDPEGLRREVTPYEKRALGKLDFFSLGLQFKK